MSIPAEYRIRPARGEDLAELSAIERDADRLFGDYGWPRDEDGEETGEGSYTVWLAKELKAGLEHGSLWVAADEQDRPVGFALAKELDGAGHIEELDVRPAHGRRGLGAALVKAVCGWAQRAQYPAVTLTTEADVPWNAPYYRRLGFRVLTDGEMEPGLQAQLQKEIGLSKPWQRRVAMRREL